MSLLSLLGQAPATDYQMTYGTNSSALDTGIAAGAFLVGICIALFAVAAVYIISALCLSRIFKKAGIEAWKAWVPIYNTWVLLELGGQQGFWAVLALVPVINIIAAIFLWIAMYNIGLGFGKPSAFILLAIFFPLIWLIWLAVDSSKWKGNGAQSATSHPANTPPQTPAAPIA